MSTTKRISRRALLEGSLAAGALGVPATAGLRPARAQVPAAGRAGKTLRVTMNANLSQVDPNKRRGIFEFNVHRALYNTLLTYDTKAQLAPELATTYESPDARNYTFKLRPGVKWHDGKDFTAEDVHATFLRVKDPNLGARRDQRLFVELMETMGPVDRLTYRVRFKQPSVVALDQLMKLPIVRADFDATKPVGTGPFVFEEWVKDQHLRARRFDRYWKPGKPGVDAIVYSFVTDEQQQINKLLAGETDVLTSPPIAQLKRLARSSGTAIHLLPKEITPNFYFLLMRTDRPPFDNVKVRQAVNHAIDRQALLQITEGFGEVRSNPVPANHWSFSRTAPSYDQPNVELAKKLMAEAGRSSGTSVVFKYFTEFAELGLAAQIIQADLAKIGIDVKLEKIDLGVYADQVLQKFDYDMSMTLFVPLYDPEDMLATVAYRYDSVALRWKNDDFLAMLDEGNATTNLEARKRAFGRAQDLWMREVPGAVLSMAPVRLAARSNVKNVVLQAGGYAEYEHVTLD
jgi:peptide/nickel transport system substrate-binding protein